MRTFHALFSSPFRGSDLRSKGHILISFFFASLYSSPSCGLRCRFLCRHPPSSCSFGGPLHLCTALPQNDRISFLFFFPLARPSEFFFSCPFGSSVQLSSVSRCGKQSTVNSRSRSPPSSFPYFPRDIPLHPRPCNFRRRRVFSSRAVWTS